MIWRSDDAIEEIRFCVDGPDLTAELEKQLSELITPMDQLSWSHDPL
ncbi:MAG TPA: hypothetical protein QGF58_29320 [Myxococcota bacterium]|nr:hypothetical protein [Myxococcota bacterium]